MLKITPALPRQIDYARAQCRQHPRNKSAHLYLSELLHLQHYQSTGITSPLTAWGVKAARFQ